MSNVIDGLFQIASPVPSTVSNPTSNPESDWKKNMNLLPRQPKKGDEAIGFDGKRIPDTKFEKRLILAVDDIYRGPNPARQEHITEAEAAAKVKTSLGERGFLPYEAGEGIIIERVSDEDRLNKKNPKFGYEFQLVAGYHRSEAHEKLAIEYGSFWKYIIADVYAYVTPLARDKHAGATNCHADYRTPASNNDIYHQIDLSITKGNLKNTREDIGGFVNVIAAHKSARERKKILDRCMKLRPADLGNNRKLRSLTSDLPLKDRLTDHKSAHKVAVEMNLPVSFGKGASRTTIKQKNGRSDIQTYLSDEAAVEKALAGISKWDKAGRPTDGYVLLALYVNTADLSDICSSDAALLEKRKNLWNKVIERLDNYYQTMVGSYRQFLVDFNLPSKTDAELYDYVKRTCPVKFAGFLPQIVSADPSKDGLPVETTMVDYKGNPYDYLSNIG